MNLAAVMLFVILAGQSSAQNTDVKGDRGYSKYLQVSKGGSLSVDIQAGNVDIRPWARDAFSIQIENLDKDEFDNISVTQSGNDITVTTTGDIEYLDDVVISIPEEFSVDINTMGGNVEINGSLDGAVTIRTAGGNIDLKNVTKKVNIKTAGGNISTGNLDKEVTIKTSGGNIETGNLGGTASVSTAGGNIEVKSAKGDLSVSTSGGNIEIKDAAAALSATTAGGSIEVGKILGTTKLSTSGGDIEVKSAAGELTAKTAAGDIEVANVLKSFTASTSAGDIKCAVKTGFNGEIKLDTKMGSIYLILPSGVNASVDATVKGITAWGDIDYQNYIFSDFTPSRKPEVKGKKEVSANFEINGGGNKINLKTSIGTINIRKGK